jgi:glutamate mutase epsilon subunit
MAGRAREIVRGQRQQARSIKYQLTCDDVIAMSDDRGVSHIDDL